MNLFSAKSIGLYSLAIASAIVFFKVVTSYGEANIKAPISIAGDYLITAQNLPNCFQKQPLFLRLQQSGIYLNASLVKVRDIASRPTFSGRLSVRATSPLRQLNLSGLLPTSICPQSSQLRLAASVSKSGANNGDIANVMRGQLWLNSSDVAPASPVEFTGTFERQVQSSPSH